MKKILKFVTLIAGLRFLVKILSENVDVKIQIQKLRDELATLETKDLEKKLKAFFKKYDSNSNNHEEQEEL
jgi:Ca2+-binding EF-hand superfamily protein